jgi:hypothetical protein
LVGLRLFDHLIRSEQKRRRDGQAQRLGGLEVDHQLELRGLLNGEIGRLGPFEDLVHVHGRESNRVCLSRSVGDKTAGLSVFLEGEDC